MSIQPKGENVRRAVKWISSERVDRPQTALHKLIEEAAVQFNLTPMETNSLERTLQEDGSAPERKA